jgi:hypothetical protein
VVHERVKGRPQGLWGWFYRARRARGGDGWSNGHQWPWGAVLIALGGAFNWRGNRRGLREEVVAGALDALDGVLKEGGAEGG